MSETAVELSDKNDLFGNLFTRTRPTTNNSNSHVTDLTTIQSETRDEDGENIENIPFQEVLGQHIINLTAQDTLNSQKSNNPSSESSTAELLQENSKEINPSLSHKPPMSSGTPRNAKNPNTSSSLKGELDGYFSSIKRDTVGSEWAFPGEQKLNTIHLADNLSKTFTEDPDHAIQNSGQNPFLKNGLVEENVNLPMYNPSILNSNNKNPSAPLASKGELREINIQPNKQFLNINSSGFSFPAETPAIQNLTVRNALSNSGNVELNPANNPENPEKFDHSISNTIREPEFESTDFDTVNIRELPESFKSLFQTVSTEEKRHTTLIHEISNPLNATERHTRDDLSKINSNASSKHDILNTLQTNDEWNLSDNLAQKQDTFISMPFDMPVQNTDNSYHFSMDTQTTTDGIQSDSTPFQQNAAVFSGSSTSQLSSTETYKDTVGQAFHRSFTAGTEYTHNNIIGQLFQRISLVTRGDRSEVKLHLTPPELGSVKIHFTEENDEIEAKIFVENAEVKAAIENNAHRLKESLAASGMEIQKLEVYIQNDTANKQDSLENPNTNNQHYQADSQERRNQDHSVNEDSTSNTMQTETGVKSSNLMVDYLI